MYYKHLFLLINSFANNWNTYIFIYLLVRGHWNLFVPVRASGGRGRQPQSSTSATSSPIKGASQPSGAPPAKTSTDSSQTQSSSSSSAPTTSPKTGVDLNIKSDKKSNKKLEYEKVGEYVTYTAKQNYAFKLVKDHKTELWQASDASDYSFRVEVDHLDNESKAVTIHLPGNKTKVFKKDGSNKLWKDIDTTKVTASSINIDFPQQSYIYKNKLGNNVRTFTTKTGFAFNGAYEYVDGNKVEIWKTDKENRYVNKIEIDLMNNDSKAVTIYFPGNTTKLFMKYNKNDPWTEINISKVNPKSINIEDDKETYFYSNKFDNDVRTFTAKKGFAFNFVNYGTGTNKIEIWKTDKESDYANKIEVDPINKDSKAVTVYTGDKTKIFMKRSKNDPWDEIDTTKIIPEPLDIDYSHERYFYKNELDNNVRIFTAKKGFAFKCVNEYVNKKIVEIWKTDKESDYVNKIEVDLINNDSKAVTIHISDKKTRVFKKDCKADPWTEIDTNKDNLMSVYVDYSHDSYICKNVLNGDTRTFTAKRGFTFNGAHEYINDNRVAIWKADNESYYSNKIEVDLMNDDAKAITIHLAGNKTKVLMKDSMGSPWKEIDTNKVNPKSVNIQNKYDCHFYTNNLDNGVRTFTAKTGFFFNRVKDDNTNIWTSKKKEFAEKVVVETNNRLIIYIGDDGHAKVFDKKENGTWIEHIERQRVRLFKANPSNTANPLQLGANEYTSSTSGNMVSYHIVEGVNCVQLFFDDVLLWVYDSTQHGGIYPKSVYHDTTTNVLILRFAGLDMTFENTHDGWIYTESGPLAVKFHVVDPNNPNNTVELASNQFTVTEIGDVTTFNIADGVNCIALSYGPALLWQHDPNQRGGRYPNSLYYIQSTNRLLLRFDDLFMTFLKNDQGEWVYTETYTPGMGADAPESGYCTPCEEDRFSTTGDEDPDTQSIASSTVTAQSRLRLFKANPRNAANPLELSANEYNLTQTGYLTSYQIANGVNCAKLMFGDVILWEYDPNERGGIYPESVYHDTTTNVLILRFAGLDMTFENTHDGWIYTESGPLAVKFHVVDPNNPNNTVELASNQFTVTEIGDVTTFNIADGVNCIALSYGPALLWQHDPNQRGGIYPESLHHNTRTDVLLLRFAGLDLTFENTDDGWIFTESGPLAVKFYVVDPKDSSKTVKLAINKLRVTERGDLTTFTIPRGVNPIALTYGPALLWQQDSTKTSAKGPKSLDFTKSTETIVLWFEGLCLTFAKNTQGEWVYTETKTSGRGSDTASESGYSILPDDDGFSTTPDEDGSQSGGQCSHGTVEP
ncbi:hypothetical protein MACJ_002531 [Theileria orientalis]|uniref:Uncharacterized protein n=1 Tax=Theileria orientalis TaxID=68886 RepID=A0A976M6B6_THEOR|nr:hypothetical protein MACJ_002531 [Theileria orientalis]